MNLHGGSLTLTSIPEVGTTATMTFPTGPRADPLIAVAIPGGGAQDVKYHPG